MESSEAKKKFKFKVKTGETPWTVNDRLNGYFIPRAEDAQVVKLVSSAKFCNEKRLRESRCEHELHLLSPIQRSQNVAKLLSMTKWISTVEFIKNSYKQN